MSSDNAFFKVYPNIKVSSTLQDLFEDVVIERAEFFMSKKELHLHILSKRLIHKQYIYAMEEAVCNLNPYEKHKVIIVERYNLSAQYTLSKLTDIYKDSLLFEVEHNSPQNFRHIKNSEWFFEGNVITLNLEDSFLVKARAPQIKEFLEEVYRDRFGMDIKVGFNYTEADKAVIKQAKERRLAMELEAIAELNNISNDDNDSTNDNTENSDSRDNENKNTNKTRTENKSNNGSSNMAKGKTTKNNDLAKNTSQRTDNKKNNYVRGGKASGSYDPDVIYGRNVEGDVVNISELAEGYGQLVIKGKILTMEDRELRNGEKSIVTFSITDYTDTIVGKLFIANDDMPSIKEVLGKNKYYLVKGVPVYDTYSKELTLGSITGIKAISDFTETRKDNALEKRVELHMHTVMSDMDSVVDIGDIIKRANNWGHPAIAITDHGVAQAFPVANHVLPSDAPLKIIYGVEGYFVDDLKSLVTDSRGQSLDDTYVVFDIETTGLSPKHNKIIEIGAVKITNGEIIDRYSTFVNPETPIPYTSEKLTGINDEMVIDAPTIEVILPQFLEWAGDNVLVAHNASFDTGFIRFFSKKQSLVFDNTILDTLALSHILLSHLGKFTLDRVCKDLGIVLENHHRAVDDAEATAKIFLKFVEILKNRGLNDLDEVNNMAEVSLDAVKKASRYHGIILAKNEIGRVNLYRLISEAHIKYFFKRPITPKSLINKYREGLIIGSACEAGELFRAIVDDADDEEIAKIVSFYDYLEIQPLGNDEFMVVSDKYSKINSLEDIKDINRKIVKLGELFNKPVVATCDVHFLDPEDSIYRAMLMASKGFKDADSQPPLYFRTTQEMLEEFEYLGKDKAFEVVVTNTNKVANMVDRVSPVRPDKAAPEIPNSDDTLTNICYDKAHEIYGPNLPDIVVARLEKELNSIISNGFAVMYIIAQKLVWKSNEDGYLVGSRGSVGSSFVATMSGITEVNPLSAHYICPECYYVDFDSELVKSYSGSAGCDLPDAVCPHCGHQLDKEGHDIPFETFLGFKGDKEPDIDLNFSSEYQSNAHAYTEELFGEGHAFRAGTIGTIAEKTAFGYVYKYNEERGITRRRCEMERMALGCTGTKRTTGQHPGGMIVLPSDEEIYSFTPIQRPANDMKTSTTTTHFEYHSIDHNLLKLDILGHADPTMIRRLEDITGTNATKIKLDDKDVMSLFHGTAALGIEPKDISGTTLGCLGVPEFGTDFVIQMLIDTKPQSFSDLVRISGLSHGTDVWLGNAQTLIQEGKTILSKAICCRDDIMVYLIHMGLEEGLAFTIMESVRKGKGLRDEWIDDMLAHDVPDWYIWSCKKIKYMFPKAHAAAYVMMAWRIAYYKVNYPLAYYTAYFSIRAKAFNYEKMCMGLDRLKYEMTEIRKKGKEGMSNVEENELGDMKLVEEMYARGFEFVPIDLYKADDINFQIIDGKIMPPFSAIDKMGESAAAGLKAAAKEGTFSSKEDVRIRSKIGKTTIEKMSELGIISNLPDTDQLSLSDLFG